MEYKCVENSVCVQCRSDCTSLCLLCWTRCDLFFF